ncbi:sensor histidine kinase [Trueperella sp.]|uniref:sensor histidine kinase n=1 Tax=Trueperella sp. TaxID=2699835 RepID=UPI003734D932
MWSFHPVDSFEHNKTKRAYQLFEWMLILAVPLLSFLSWLLLYGFAFPDQIFSHPPVVGAMTLQIVTSTAVYARWVRKGVELPRDWRSVAIMSIPFLVIVVGFPILGYGAHLPAALVSVAVPVSSLITSIAPSWLGLIPVSLMTGFAVASDVEGALAALVAIFAASQWGTYKTTVWYLSVFRVMEDAAVAKSQVRVTEERLRFAADLHDIMGQRLAAISLHTQIAQQLNAQGKDVSHTLNDILDVTDQSTRDLRHMITHYDVPVLQAELAGAVSLLEAAGADVVVIGDVPENFTTTAAYVIREAATNILKHSEARRVDITLDLAGVRVTNDGVRGDSMTGGTGLKSLARRVEPAQLTWGRDEDEFTVEVRWSHD